MTNNLAQNKWSLNHKGIVDVPINSTKAKGIYAEIMDFSADNWPWVSSKYIFNDHLLKGTLDELALLSLNGLLENVRPANYYSKEMGTARFYCWSDAISCMPELKSWLSNLDFIRTLRRVNICRLGPKAKLDFHRDHPQYMQIPDSQIENLPISPKLIFATDISFQIKKNGMEYIPSSKAFVFDSNLLHSVENKTDRATYFVQTNEVDYIK